MPMPEFKLPFLPRPSAKELTEPVPFHLLTEKKSSRAESRLQKENHALNYQNPLGSNSEVFTKLEVQPLKLTSPHSPKLLTKMRRMISETAL